MIDGFGTAQSLVVSGGIGPASVAGGLPATDAIGGARHATLMRVDGYGTDALIVDGGGFGRLDLSSAAADTVVARLLYDGGEDADLLPTGLGGADLTDSGSNTLIRILARSDLVGAPITITVYSDAGNASSATRNLPGLGFASFTAIDIPFTEFAALTGLGPANFGSVGAIVVELSGAGTPSLDAQLDSIVATVPEPASAALLAAGLVGLVVAGRRRGGAGPA